MDKLICPCFIQFWKEIPTMSIIQEPAIPAFSIPIPILRPVLGLVDSDTDTDTRKNDNFDSDFDTDTKVI